MVGYLTIYQEKLDDLDNYLIFMMTNEKFKNQFFVLTNVLVAVGVLMGNALNFYPLVNFFNKRLNDQQNKRITLKMMISLYSFESPHEEPQLSPLELDERKKSNKMKIIFFLFSIAVITMTVFSLLKVPIELTFDLVSTFAVPPISFLFPFMLFNKLVSSGHFGEKTTRYRFLAVAGIVLSVVIWAVAIGSMYFWDV